MNRVSKECLEDAAFLAWPCLGEERVAGWRLRHAEGFTKRANSANAGPQAQVLSPAALDDVERRYRAKGQATVYRLIAGETGEAMDQALAARGYQHLDPSLVMICELSGAENPDAANVHETNGYKSHGHKSHVDNARGHPASEGCGLQSLDPQAWLEVFHAISAKPDTQAQVHLRLLQAMPGQTAFMVLLENGEPVSCGIAALTGPCVGLFEIATQAELRGRGHGARLCRGLLAWGRASGGRTGYLQVDGQNLAAIRLYERLGFRSFYEYWYRVSG